LPRLGAPKAITATGHRLGRIVYDLLKHGEAYTAEVRARQEKQLRRRARELGDMVLKVEAKPSPAAEEVPVTAR